MVIRRRVGHSGQRLRRRCGCGPRRSRGRRRRSIYISHTYSDRADRENSSAEPGASAQRSSV